MKNGDFDNWKNNYKILLDIIFQISLNIIFN